MKITALVAFAGLFLMAEAAQASYSCNESVNEAIIPFDEKIPGIVYDSRAMAEDESSEDMDETSEFFKQGKSWIFRREEFDYDAFCFKVKTERITVVDYFDYEGLRVAKLLHERIEDNKQYFSACYVKNGIIYYSSYSEKKLQFFPQLDFKASPGQELENYGMEPGEKTKYVSDVLPMVIRGVARRVYVVRYISGKDICGYWIEGIGTTVRTASMTSYLYPAGAPSIKDSEVREADSTGSDLIACYEDGECIYSIDDLKDIVAESGMFREDLRWNYWIGSSSMGRLPTITSIRYDGTTEYGGLTYHRLVNNYRLNSYGVEESFGRRYWVESGKPVLVRKAGAKIYARFPKDWSESWKEDDKDYATEYQLVDFDCRAGETFKGLSDCGIIDVEVIREENVRIGENEARALVVIPHYPVYSLPTAERRNASSSSAEEEDEEEEKEIRIIEGVGIEGTYGFSYIFLYDIRSGSPAVKKVIGWDNGLTSVFHSLTDTAGDILYPEREPDEADMAINGSEPDRIWEYATVQELPSDQSGEAVTKYTLSSYWFDGLERRGDRIYKKLCLKGEKTWTVTDKGNGVTECSPVEEVDKDECVGLFREWGGNLYMLPEEKEVSYTRYPYSDFSKRPLEEGEEITLYPLGIKSGNEADAWFDGYLANVAIGGKRKCPDNEWLTEVEITSAISQNSLSEGGNAGAGIVFGKKYVSGVGNTGLGTFWNPKPNDDPAQYKMNEPRTFFNNLNAKKWWTGEWELLYKGADISPTNPGAVGDIAADNVNDNAPAAVYDLCGRTVLTGASGSDLRNLPKGIYIYKGRKIII